MDCFAKINWLFFIKHKDDQYKIIINFIKKFELETRKKIKEWCCNKGGEDKVLPDKLIKENQSINFEFTPCETPQFNGVVERAFAMLYGRIRAMLSKAKLPQDMRDKL